MSRKRKVPKHTKNLILLGLSGCFIVVGAFALWIATLDMPDLNSFESRKIQESTKIYDRTGQILLFDTGTNAKRTAVTLTDISPLVQNATIAIEDSNFYHNSGVEPLSILRAVLADVTTGGFSQGASTITQQVVKNSLLTQDKTIARKIKEWVLAVKLTRAMTKDQILETYFNDTSYGGTIYGVEEASHSFFGKAAKDVTLGEAAYLAAIPQAPTYFSPYGSHTTQLDSRHKLVLDRMKALGMITDDEYKKAVAEKVNFLSKNDGNIRAPHFVMYVREYLLEKYGEDEVDSGGLKVTTTLDYGLQQDAEQVVDKFMPSLETNFHASNAAMVAIDPKTGDIVTMVGSKDYFSTTTDGNYNVALAKRQPGSTFKPFVYSTAFKKGYTPETMLFDVQTEFSTYCNPDGTPIIPSTDPKVDPKTACYMPGEYDDTFEGPLTIRQALAQSRNIPAVEALYLAGIPASIHTAQDMGITTLSDPNRYGLTLVLGGGEVTLLDLTSAYGVFANDGVRNPYRSILRVEDSKGTILEEASDNPAQVLQPEVARQISDILSDNNVRMDSLKPIGDSVGRQVAIKTGTTNDYRDVWTEGYTPNLVVGAWAGNNNNSPMEHNVAGLIISPLWGAFMSEAIKKYPVENFQPPPPPLADGKPVLRGIWQGGVSYKIDSVSGKLATAYTPPETTQEAVVGNVHNILYWLNKDDPRGPTPTNPQSDSQFDNWEYSVRKWFDVWHTTHPQFQENQTVSVPKGNDDVHTPDKAPHVSITIPAAGAIINPNNLLSIQLQSVGAYPAAKTDVYLNGKYVLTAAAPNPLSFSFVPTDIGIVKGNNTLSVTVYDTASNKGQATTNFVVQ